MLKGIKGYSKKRITSLSTRGMGTAPQTATATIEMAGTRTATIATAPPAGLRPPTWQRRRNEIFASGN